MKPDAQFTGLPKSFWASVRSISQECGYTDRGKGQVKVPTPNEISEAFTSLGLNHKSLASEIQRGSTLMELLYSYFRHRAEVLNDVVEPLLMNAEQAKNLYEQLYAELKPTCPLPLNKQKGDKRAPNFLTCMVNMLIERGIKGHYSADYDPRQLTTFTNLGTPLRTLSRRVDGAFPSTLNPVAVWEIKEYYYTTTFGSRVADGVYETLLDGLELEELESSEGVSVLHYLFLDAHYTWWECGRSYLCRIVDMLQMGLVDEVVVGREVVTRVPVMVKHWISLLSGLPK
jgi:hypothetical protein